MTLIRSDAPPELTLRMLRYTGMFFIFGLKDSS